jgi:hypothetical protein
MIREQRKVDQWQRVMHTDLGPGQYSPYQAKDGGKYAIGPQ